METKPAPKTTEFWIHAALQIFFLLNTLQVWTYVSPRYSGIIQAILAAAYTIGRGQAKSGVPYVPPTSDTTEDPATFPAE